MNDADSPFKEAFTSWLSLLQERGAGSYVSAIQGETDGAARTAYLSFTDRENVAVTLYLTATMRNGRPAIAARVAEQSTSAKFPFGEMAAWHQSQDRKTDEELRRLKES